MGEGCLDPDVRNACEKVPRKSLSLVESIPQSFFERSKVTSGHNEAANSTYDIPASLLLNSKHTSLDPFSLTLNTF